MWERQTERQTQKRQIPVDRGSEKERELTIIERQTEAELE